MAKYKLKSKRTRVNLPKEATVRRLVSLHRKKGYPNVPKKGASQDIQNAYYQSYKANKKKLKLGKAGAVQERQDATLNYLQGYKSGVVKRNSLDMLADMQGNNKLVHKSTKMIDRDIRALDTEGWIKVTTTKYANPKITKAQRFQHDFKQARTIYVRPSQNVLDHNIRYNMTQAHKYRVVQAGKKWKVEVDLGFGHVPVNGVRFKSKGNAYKGILAMSKEAKVRFPNVEQYIDLKRTKAQFDLYKEQANTPINLKK